MHGIGSATFTADPVVISCRPSAAAAESRWLRERCRRDGFALFTVTDDQADSGAILTRIATQLGLGEPYVPAIYAHDRARFGYDSAGFNTIAPTAADSRHRYFGTGAAQGFHTDGTLEPIGTVGTSLLWFQRAALEGGHTTIFRATDAFDMLRRSDPPAAESLMADDALTRIATSLHPQQRHTGPAFAELKARVRTRWADDGNQIWHLDNAPARARAVALLRELAQPGSPFRLDLPVKSRTGLLLANSRVAHGRTAFRAAPGERILVRGLYTGEVG
ncbi:TauD/TfdA family dioxygenase [Nocardia cyriacigeorgica]|uniref:TauD/TfdA family dioxygenase n=1 Tax=Nocardia TaxID=1817 RepID=UPI001893F98C|nr:MULTISPECIES: TauD/TfdA family dioxygenase [Nocardia]MBF6102294.1 TauD/TfdA family dioxygenase [Nocardia cyriacigeorgica]